MSQKVQFDADVFAVEGEMPVFFRFNGKTYQGQRTPIAERQQMDDAGYLLNLDSILTVRLAEIGNLMKIRDTIEIYDEPSKRWVSYRIETSTPDQAGVAVEFGLVQNT